MHAVVYLWHFYTAAPVDLDVTVNDQHYVNISWMQPWMATRHGSLLYYVLNCSMAEEEVGTPMIGTQKTMAGLQLLPYQTYQCCVSVVNEAGNGYPACELFVTNEGGKINV